MPRGSGVFFYIGQLLMRDMISGILRYGAFWVTG